MSTEIYDLENYRPDDYESFCFTVTISVGIKGQDGADMFNRGLHTEMAAGKLRQSRNAGREA